MKYRAEIDGLRAVAVIPVILFHAGLTLFKGGFVGVDIFFVISGYLITTIILSEKDKGHFSLANFYERRARRILPALFLVMLFSLVFSWLWLLPADMRDFSKSLMAVPTFSSNILFWKETGYWGTDNELKPLLHTWSLAVEEQYYVLFPLLLAAVWKSHRKSIGQLIVGIAVVSLAYSHWAAYEHPTSNFFLLSSRAWELAIGAIVAYYFLYIQPINPLLLHPKLKELLAFLGLLLISVAIFAFSSSTPFPSLYALVPTTGTALIILFASSDTLVGKILGSKIPVTIGLISYSAYLWHQPLLALARQRSITSPSLTLLLGLAALSLVLAYLSWRYVEKPFRTKGTISRQGIVNFGVAGSLFFILIGFTGYKTQGFSEFPLRDQLSYTNVDQKLSPNYGLNIYCQSFSLAPECHTSDQPEILVWGDSYAMHLVKGIMASHPNAKVAQITKTVCGPFFDIAPTATSLALSWTQECLDFNKNVKEWLKTTPSIKYIVMSSPFSQYLTGKVYSRDKGEIRTDENMIANELINTMDEIRQLDITPIVFSSTPQNGTDIGQCLAKTIWNRLETSICDFTLQETTLNSQKVAHLLTLVASHHKVIDLSRMICETGICKTQVQNVWIYRDVGHLSQEGSEYLGKKYNFYRLITGSKNP